MAKLLRVVGLLGVFVKYATGVRSMGQAENQHDASQVDESQTDKDHSHRM